MSNCEPQQIKIETETERDREGRVTGRRTRFSLDTEDVIAIFAGIVVLIFAVGMLVDLVPINELTIGVLGFSGVGGVIAEIIKASRRRSETKRTRAPKGKAGGPHAQ